MRWTQVHSWRLGRHYLLERAKREDMLPVVTQIGGLHAQMMSAAELSLWARVQDLMPDDVPNALWRDRTLVKTWAMRGTLHLLTARDYPLYVAALSSLKHFLRGSWLKFHGISTAELQALLEGVPLTLTDQGMTREQLAVNLSEKLGKPILRDLLLSGWGALLKPAAFGGNLCFGPNQGQNVTFVRPSLWLGEWEALDSQEALCELARRYLKAYEPVTMDEFARWLGIDMAKVKRIFKQLGDEVVPVEVEGWKGWALADSVAQIEAAEAPGTVRLLPHFDTYTVSLSKQRQFLMDMKQQARVYRQQGWISPVVLVDGRIVGVWGYEKKKTGVSVSIELFAKANIKRGIEAEARRLGEFLGGEAQVVYVEK